MSISQEDFRNQVVRLEIQFNTKYGEERSKILYKMVCHFSPEWFKRTIDAKLSASRQVPLPADFLEDIAIERERNHQREKEKNAKDAKKFDKDMATGWGSFPDSDKADICRKIRQRITGNMNDQDWASFMSSLENAANSSPLPDSAGHVKAKGEL